MYCIFENGQAIDWPLTLEEVKKRFPNVSFTANPTSSELDGLKVGIIQKTESPNCDPSSQSVKEVAPIFSNGEWQQSWEIVELSEADALVAEQDQAAMMRSRRNGLLAACDWTQLPDSPVDASPWALYRELLRAVPQQAGFPWQINWPSEPA